MDAGAFSEMKELMGDAFNDIITMCLQSLPEQLAEIETAIKDQNADAIFNVSHKMKSSCGSIGAFGLAEKAEAIEVIGREGSADISAELYEELHGATQQVLLILNSELGNNSSAP
jgi:HPt (histidine-containing phosphotransfer) domain-containing protein